MDWKLKNVIIFCQVCNTHREWYNILGKYYLYKGEELLDGPAADLCLVDEPGLEGGRVVATRAVLNLHKMKVLQSQMDQ